MSKEIIPFINLNIIEQHVGNTEGHALYALQFILTGILLWYLPKFKNIMHTFKKKSTFKGLSDYIINFFSINIIYNILYKHAHLGTVTDHESLRIRMI